MSNPEEMSKCHTHTQICKSRTWKNENWNWRKEKMCQKEYVPNDINKMSSLVRKTAIRVIFVKRLNLLFTKHKFKFRLF
jgi:hypothetical protein